MSDACSTGSCTGSVEVGAISGSFLYDLTLEDLVVRDTSGALLADLPRVRASYRLPNLLAGQVVLSAVAARAADDPAHQAPQRPDELRGRARPRARGGPGGQSPLVEFHDVRIDSGHAQHRHAVEPAARARAPRPRATPRSRRSGPSRAGSSRRAPRGCAR